MDDSVLPGLEKETRKQKKKKYILEAHEQNLNQNIKYNQSRI